MPCISVSNYARWAVFPPPIPIVILADVPVEKQAFLAHKVNAILARPFSSPDLHQLLRSLSAAQAAVSGPGTQPGAASHRRVHHNIVVYRLCLLFYPHPDVCRCQAQDTPPSKGKAVMSRIGGPLGRLSGESFFSSDARRLSFPLFRCYNRHTKSSL